LEAVGVQLNREKSSYALLDWLVDRPGYLPGGEAWLLRKRENLILPQRLRLLLRAQEGRLDLKSLRDLRELKKSDRTESLNGWVRVS
jgi:hypothetical protein